MLFDSDSDQGYCDGKNQSAQFSKVKSSKKKSKTQQPPYKEYSSWQHCFRHFQQQLFNLKCRNEALDRDSFSKGLMGVMNALNQKRVLSGADNRVPGLHINKVEPGHVLLFTAQNLSQSFRERDLKDFLDAKSSDSSQLFAEVLRWDQKLSVVDFSYDSPKSASNHLAKLVQRYKGHYFAYHSSNDKEDTMKFQALKSFIVDLATNLALPLAILDYRFKGGATSGGASSSKKGDKPANANLEGGSFNVSKFYQQ